MRQNPGQLPWPLSKTRFYQPHVFQGRLDKRPYFEGWYFKIVDEASGLSMCLIPGVSLTADGKAHGFIQYADNLSGSSGKVDYPLEDLSFSSEALNLTLGPQHLSSDRLSLVSETGFPYTISLQIAKPLLYPVSLGHPGIMGPFRFAPAMECYHGVYLVEGRVTGTVTIGDQAIEIQNGAIYIEKDWGRSFPSAWIWLQASQFKATEDILEDSGQRPEPQGPVHLMLSVANIPWIGRHFVGHLGYLWLGDLRIGLGTYRGSQVTIDVLEDGGVQLVANSGLYHIVITATPRQTVNLIAPSAGAMVRYMEESLGAQVVLEVYRDGELIYEGTSQFAGYERCGVLSDLGIV